METVHKSMSFDWDKALIQRIHELSSLNTSCLVTWSEKCFHAFMRCGKHWPTQLMYTKKTIYHSQTQLNVQQISRTCLLFTQQKKLSRIMQKRTMITMDHSLKEFKVSLTFRWKYTCKLLYIYQNNTGLIVIVFANLWNIRLDHS